MAADTLDARMARLEGAYEQITKRLDDLQGSVQQFRSEVRSEFQQLRVELRSQFRHFAALVLPLWLATAALFFRH